MTPWVEPSIFWSEEADRDKGLDTLRTQSTLLATWPPVGFEREPTYCFRSGTHYCIWQPEVGGVTFTAENPSLSLHPLSTTDRSFFSTLVFRSWLPAIYPLWGRQVLHASAVADDEGVTVGFSGPSGAGKSTIAYALGQRPGWSIIADDTIAFSRSPLQGAPVVLHPLRLQSRLRIETARYFGKSREGEEAFAWPQVAPVLAAVYMLDCSSECSTIDITKESLSNSYAELLRQAHAMSLNDEALNQQLMRDYGTLVTSVEVFRLSYPKRFESLPAALDCVESHVAQLKRQHLDTTALRREESGPLRRVSS